MALGDGQLLGRVRSYITEPMFGNVAGMTPDDVARRRAISEALLGQSMSNEPVTSITGGLNKMLQAFLGARGVRQAENSSIFLGQQAEQEAAAAEAASRDATRTFAGSILGGQQPGGAPAPASPTPFNGMPTRANAETQRLLGTLPGAAPAAAGSPYRDAISGIESGGDYSLLGPVANAAGDRAYGRYQVMGANVGPWTEQVLGERMTPQQFLASPEAQDAVFDAIFGGYVSQYGPEGAARAWFTGSPTGGGRDVLGTTADHYVDMFNGGLGAAGGAPAGAPGAPPADPRNQAIMQALASDDPTVFAMGQQMLQQRIEEMMAPPATPEGFTLAENAIRYDANGNEIAANRGAGDFMERPLTPEERVMWSVSPNSTQTWVMTANGPEARGSTPLVDNRQESAQSAAMGKAVGEMFANMFTEGVQAGDDLAMIGQLEGLLNVTGGGLMPALQSVAGRFGIELGENVGEVQAAEAIINFLTPRQRVPGSGSTSNFDASMFARSLPALMNQPEGNRLIIDTMRALAQAKYDRAEIASKVVNGEWTSAQGLEAIRALPDPYAAIRPLMGGAPAATPTPGAPAPAVGVGVAIPPPDPTGTWEYRDGLFYQVAP